MNKKVNISAIQSKIHFIYKDERERNIAAIVVYNKDGKFFFDPDYKNEMSNLEVEALLLRGALVDRGGKYYRPSSFNENNVSFSDAVIDPEDIESVEPSECDIPKVFFNGNKPTTKDDVNADIEYISKTEHFKAYVSIKCQGTSSMNYPKKNYTIKIFDDEEKEIKLKKDFKGWGKQNKFCLKANYIDHSHARNICCAKLWGQIVKTRNDFDDLPPELTSSPNMGAIDGFPFKLYYNNSYEGIYTWNIPKDAWMTNMDDEIDTHCILCGEEYVSGCFRTVNAKLWSDEVHENMPDTIVTSFNAFQNFVLNSTDDDFINNLSDYANINSLIDYYIFNYVICGLDSMGKNQLFLTYDGVVWIASAYDMDSTMGLYWNGSSFVSPKYKMQEDYESGVNTRSYYNGEGNLLYVRLETLFKDEIRARYSELRNDVLSYANVVNVFERFTESISTELYNEDTTIYTSIPSAGTNNIQQIRNYYRDRLAYVDSMIMEDPDVPDTPDTPDTPDVPEEGAIYTLSETQVLDGTSKYIDTGIALLEEDIDYTIFIDFSMNNQPTAAVKECLLHCMNEVNPYPGISIQSDDTMSRFELSGANISSFSQTSSTSNASLIPIDVGVRHSVFVRREGNTITITTEVGTNSGSYTHKSTDKHLLIGAYQSSTGAIGRYTNCTLYQVKVWNRALSDDEISSYISEN